MKGALTFFLIILSGLLNAQLLDSDSITCCSIIQFEYSIIDTAHLKNSSMLRNIKVSDVISYNDTLGAGGSRIAFKRGNKWLSFNTGKDKTNDFRWINLDDKGAAELILKGIDLKYGSGGGCGFKWIKIINVDSIPTQLFDLTYGCFCEDFPKNESSNGYGCGYERKILFKKRSFTIGSVPLGSEKCQCALLPSWEGTLLIKNGRIVRKGYSGN